MKKSKNLKIKLLKLTILMVFSMLMFSGNSQNYEPIHDSIVQKAKEDYKKILKGREEWNKELTKQYEESQKKYRQVLQDTYRSSSPSTTQYKSSYTEERKTSPSYNIPNNYDIYEPNNRAIVVYDYDRNGFRKQLPSKIIKTESYGNTEVVKEYKVVNGFKSNLPTKEYRIENRIW
jgi:hypothetical protein